MNTLMSQNTLQLMDGQTLFNLMGGIGVAKTMDPAGFGDAGGAVLPEYTAFVHY